jgi:hypothetical protein
VQDTRTLTVYAQSSAYQAALQHKSGLALMSLMGVVHGVSSTTADGKTWGNSGLIILHSDHLIQTERILVHLHED